MPNFPSNFRVDRQAGAIGVVRHTDDTTVAAKLKFIGKWPTAVNIDPAAAIVTKTMSLYLADATSAKDTDVGSSGDIVFADDTYETFAKLAAEINASDNWRMTLVGARPADLTHSTSLKIIVSAKAAAEGDKVLDEEGMRLFWDTTNAFRHTACIGLEEQDETFGKFMGRRMDRTIPRGLVDITDRLDPEIARQPVNRAAFLTQIVANATTSGTNGAVHVYAVNQTESSDALVSVAQSTSEVTTDFDPPLIAPPGYRLVVAQVADDLAVPLLSIRGGWGTWQ